MTAAISRMVVLPNHIRKFISAISPRVPATLERKRNGSSQNARGISAALTGPLIREEGEKQHGERGGHNQVGHVDDGLEEAWQLHASGGYP